MPFPFVTFVAFVFNSGFSTRPGVLPCCYGLIETNLKSGVLRKLNIFPLRSQDVPATSDGSDQKSLQWATKDETGNGANTCSDTRAGSGGGRAEEQTSELQSRQYLVCRLLLEKKKTNIESTA